MEAVSQELKQQGAGRKLWNNWRKANPEVIPDFSRFTNVVSSFGGDNRVGTGMKFIGFDFSRADFSNSSFPSTELREADLSGANLENADFSRGLLAEVNLSGGNLKNADLSQGLLTSVNFKGAFLKQTDLTGASLNKADLSKADLREANLSGASFSGAKLMAADLSGAILRGANFSDANLRGANLSSADLFRAVLFQTNLSEAILFKTDFHQANLWGANLRNADLRSTNLWGADLREAYISNGNLTDANLSDADIRAADLSNAILRRTVLVNTQALATKFEEAIFTEACLENWHISSDTNLNGITCECVYLRYPRQERRPHSGKFAPGEFTKLFEKARETVDLIFSNGIDWQAFLISFQQLQIEAGENVLSIQAIENKNDGAFVIRVSLPIELDKAEVEKCFKRKYQLALKAKDKQYRKYLQERLKDKDDLIANYREQMIEMKSTRQNNTELIAIIKTMAEKENSKYYFYQPQIGNLVDTAQSGSRQQSINHQHNYAPEQKQTLAESVSEVQQLLKQLEQTNPTATEAQQIEHINNETSANFKRRFASALQAFGETAIDEFVLENKWLKVIKETGKRWMKPE